MKTSIKINGETLDFKRNWFTGHFTYSLYGLTKVLQSAFNPFTHYSISLIRTYEITLGKTIITVKIIRPQFFAFSEPHLYQFYVDGKLIHEIKEK